MLDDYWFFSEFQTPCLWQSFAILIYKKHEIHLLLKPKPEDSSKLNEHISIVQYSGKALHPGMRTEILTVEMALTMPLVIWSCRMCFTTSNWAARCLGMTWSAIFFSSELNFLNRSSNRRERSWKYKTVKGKLYFFKSRKCGKRGETHV